MPLELIVFGAAGGGAEAAVAGAGEDFPLAVLLFDHHVEDVGGADGPARLVFSGP